MQSVCFLPIIENPHLSTICLGRLLVMRKTQLTRIEYACGGLMYQDHHFLSIVIPSTNPYLCTQKRINHKLCLEK